MSPRASWSSRLALALLALLGFAGPVSAVELDRVVQTTGAPPVAELQVAHVGVLPAARLNGCEAAAAPGAFDAPRAPSSTRRYLLHRSWLR